VIISRKYVVRFIDNQHPRLQLIEQLKYQLLFAEKPPGCSIGGADGFQNFGVEPIGFSIGWGLNVYDRNDPRALLPRL
jgi:hypothetical protein